MKLLFCYSDKIGSKIIRWGLREPVSHFALSFDESADGYGIVMHSHIQGVQITWFSDFIAHNKIVYCLEPAAPLTLQTEERIYRSLATATFGKEYDKSAFYYFALRGAMSRFFNMPLPEKNLWDDSGKFLCIEMYAALSKAYPDMFPLVAVDLAITSPYRAYSLIKQSPLIRETKWQSL